MKLTRPLVTIVVGFLIVASASADAVIVDNDDGSPGYVESGGWSTSGTPGYDGGTYRFANVGNASSATWTATLPAAGDYEVFVWYLPGANRATAARYDIDAADQTHTVYFNQSGGGYTWESLGTFSFDAGANTITLDAANSSGGDVVIADAVRFGDDGGDPNDPPIVVEVAPGVFHSFYTLPAPQAVNVLEFDLADPQYTIEMGLPHHTRNYTYRQTVSQIASEYVGQADVVGAINCGYFESGIGIIGMLGGESNLIQNRTDIWWDQQTYALLESGEGWAMSDIPASSGTARFDDAAEMDVGVLNLPCSSGTLALFLPVWGDSTDTTSEGVEVIVDNANFPFRPGKWMEGTITAVLSGPSSIDNPIPDTGFVLRACAGTESELLSHVGVGQKLAVRFGALPAMLNNARMMCTGNAWMVKDGVPFHGGGPERHPRTVIAWSGTTHWFVTFDGRQPGYAVGVSVAEMQDFLINRLHVENAINLDGGGSTTMVIEGTVVNCPSDGVTTPCTGYERAVANALLLMRRDATSDALLEDTFSPPDRALAWDDKFTCNPVVELLPPAPGGDGYVMHVMDPDGGLETTSVGHGGDQDCTVEAWIYCEYRPDVMADGFERVGLFTRDDGNAAFDATSFGSGNCYALTFDTDTGRIRAAVVTEGIVTDALESEPLYEPGTAWRYFKIECSGARIFYFVDGVQIADVTDSTHATGRFGIGHNNRFHTEENAHGAYVENFRAFCVDFDYDNDGDVDFYDLQPFWFCMLGPDHAWSPAHACAAEDGDGDLDVDLTDFAKIQRYFTGN